MPYAFPTESLSAACALCGKSYTVAVDSAALAVYRGGELVQVALPECLPSDREVVMADVRGTFFVGDCCWGDED